MIDKTKPLLLLGGNGVIGSCLKDILSQQGYNFVAPDRKLCDLSDSRSTNIYFSKCQPSYVINLAAVKTNIKLNKEIPADIYSKTVQMGLNIFHACNKYNVEKLVSVVSSCAYYPTEILKPEEFDIGPVHSSIEPHGNAKRQLFYLAKYYNQQYNLNAVTIGLNNVYGGFDYDKPEMMKVLDSLIRKFVVAKINGEKRVIVWGTGDPKREFIYYADAAEGILEVFKHYNEVDEVINIGCGYDVSIRELAYMIQDLIDPSIEVVFDTSKPDGQMKKMFDITKMKEKLGGWEPKVDIYTGLKSTIEWYLQNYVNN